MNGTLSKFVEQTHPRMDPCFCERLCVLYLTAKPEGSFEDWIRDYGLIENILLEKIAPVPSWKWGLCQLAEAYFSEAISNGGPDAKGLMEYIQQNTNPW